MSNLIENPEEIQLRERYEILAIMGNPPGWILRWGISLIFIVVAALISIGWMIEYPDTVPAQVELLTKNPPIPVVSKADGKIELFVEDNDTVEEEQILGIIENPAELGDVNRLKEYLLYFEDIENPKTYLEISSPPNLSLGILQQDYALLEQNLDAYKNYLNQKPIWRQIRSLENRIYEIDRLNNHLEGKRENLREQRDLAKGDYERNKKLFAQDAAAEIDVEQSQSVYLIAKNEYEGLEEDLIQNKIAIQRLRGEIELIKGRRGEGRSTYETEIQKYVHNLKNGIDSWKQIYLLKAPINGRIAFLEIYSQNQSVSIGQEVFTVVPINSDKDSGKIIGRAKLSIAGSGKVEIGQTVNIRLPAYPYQEFGILKGIVDKISSIPDEGTYLLEIGFPNGLITTYNETITFRQQMVGSAEIITEKRRFLERVFDKLWDVVFNK